MIIELNGKRIENKQNANGRGLKNFGIQIKQNIVDTCKGHNHFKPMIYKKLGNYLNMFW